MNAKNPSRIPQVSPPQALEQSGVMPVRRASATRAREPQPSILPDLPLEPPRRRGRPKGSRNKVVIAGGKGKWDRTQTADERQEVQRSRLLQSALSVLDKTGLAGLSVDAVAEAAAMGRQSLYLHFEGRAELLFAVHFQLVEDCFGSLDGARPGGTPLERLYETLDGVVRYAGSHPARARFALVEAPSISAPHAAIVRTYFDALASSLVLASLQKGLNHAVSTATARMLLHGFRGVLGESLLDGAPSASLVNDFRGFVEHHLGGK